MAGFVSPASIIVSGLVTGAVYGLAAMGLVFTYKISRVINYAYGAIAMFCAYCYWQFHVQWHWPTVPALVVAVVLIPAALALVSERVVYGSLAGSSVFARTAASAGMLLAIYGVSEYIWRDALGNSLLHPTSIFPNGQMHLPGVTVNYQQLGIVVSVAAIVIVIFVMLRYTMWGIRLRAVVVNPQLAQLRGVNDHQVSRWAWIASYILAAISGVLVAPLTGGDPSTLTLIVVYSLAAAVLGGLMSLPLALAGGVGLGIVGALILGYVPAGNLTSWASGVLPFAVLFVALIVQARKLSASHLGESKMAVVADLGPAALQRKPMVLRLILTVVFILIVAVVLRSQYPSYVTVLCDGVALGIIYLSFRVFTASTGMVSFAQAAFAGIGAFTAADFVSEAGLPWWLGVVLGGLIAGASSIVVSLTTVRLRGVFLALATLAFAQLVTQGLFSQESFTGSFSGRLLPRPQAFSDDFIYLILLLVVFGVVGYLCERFQHSVVGRELKAELGSTAGAQSVGIKPQQGRALAFALAAAVAGIGGALMASIVGDVSVDSWSTVPTAFLWLSTVAIAGVGSTSLMLQVGVLTAVVPQLISDNFPSIANGWVAIFGFVALLVLRVPGGAYALEARQQAFVARLRARRHKPEQAPVASPPPVQVDTRSRVKA